MNQATLNAIRRNQPLFLTANAGEIEVRVTTDTREQGGKRSRLLRQGKLPSIMAFCLEIFEHGGAINIDDLAWTGQVDIWLYGWTTDLDATRRVLRQLWQASERRSQTGQNE